MKQTENRKVVKRIDRTELAIKAMRQAVGQFEDAQCETYVEDLGSIQLVYSEKDQGLRISADNLENGWDLSFEDFTIHLMKGLVFSGDDIAKCSISLAAAFREAAEDIETYAKELLAQSK